jgi:hypothetical protein
MHREQGCTSDTGHAPLSTDGSLWVQLWTRPETDKSWRPEVGAPPRSCTSRRQESRAPDSTLDTVVLDTTTRSLHLGSGSTSRHSGHCSLAPLSLYSNSDSTSRQSLQSGLSIVTWQSEIASQCHVTVTTSHRVIMTDRDVAATVG